MTSTAASRATPTAPSPSRWRTPSTASFARYADYFIDFHTALTPDTRWALFANAPGDVGRKAEGMARAFGLKSTLPAPMDILGGSAMIAAARDGIPSLIVEMGGIGPAFERETVLEGAERLRNVLRHLGMLAGAPTDHGPLTYFSNFAWVNATRGGLFERAVQCGERVDKGTLRRPLLSARTATSSKR